VERCLAALVDDGGIGTTRDEELGGSGIARGTGPVESSAAKGIDLVDIDVLGCVVEVLLDEVVLTGLGGSNETRWFGESCGLGCHG